MVHCHNTHAFSENEGVRLIAVLFASIVFEIKSDDRTISQLLIAYKDVDRPDHK